MKNRISSKN